MAVKRHQKPAGIGGALILIVFIVLTITSFSILTLVSAKNEMGSVKKSAENAADYYNAEKEAAVKLSEIKTAIENVTDSEEIARIIFEKGANANVAIDGIEVSFKVSIDENRFLLTEININNGKFKITSQKITSENEIIIDDGFNIWNGISPLK